jgi:hypothetical protein
MGPHEVVNGANGSVTWCQGPPFCPQCTAGARACATPFQPIAQHCPGCRCGQPVIRLGGNALPPWGYRIE